MLSVSVFLPVIASILLVAYLTRNKPASLLLSMATLVVSFSSLLAASVLSGVLSDGGRVFREEYDWGPLGLSGFVLDGLSLPFAFTISLLTLAVAVYSVRYMEHRFEELGVDTWGLYYGLLLFYYSGMLGAVVASNIIEFYIFFELMLIPSYFLIAEYGYGDRQRIALMYFVWTHVGALVMLAGLLYLILSVGGEFNIALARPLARALDPTVQYYASIAISIGFLVKMAALGLHIWLPYAHAEAPTPISALLSPAMIGIGGYGILRFVVDMLPAGYVSISGWLLAWAILTMLYAGLVALTQDDIKRLLAYSSISQMGYMLLGIASNALFGFIGATYLYVSHGLGKAMLFMVAGVLIMNFHGVRSISAFGGLAKKMPATATLSLIGFLIIMGVPPTIGFISEYLVFQGLFASASTAGPSSSLLSAFVALAATILTWAYSLATVKRVFFGPLKSVKGVSKDPGLIVLAPMFALAVLSVVFGIYPFLVDRVGEWAGVV